MERRPISAPVNPGNSGGPIYDERGTLVGMTTYMELNAQNLNRGMSSGEIADYLSKHRKFRPLQDFKGERIGNMKADVAKWRSEIIDASYARLARGQDISDLLSNTVELKLPVGNFIGHLPPQLKKCAASSDGEMLYSCKFDNTVFAIRLEKLPQNAHMNRLEGKKVTPSTPSPLLQTLKAPVCGKNSSPLSPKTRKSCCIPNRCPLRARHFGRVA